ncbi:MAG TPA: carbohydrate ABC transporter permease [Clostridiales bacterium]|nr:carbohydrate ABC transporter permease [Clostridiales bacterium]
MVSYKAIKRKKAFKSFYRRVFGKSISDNIFNWINYGMFVIFAFIMLYPFMYVVKISLQTQELINNTPQTVYNFAAYGLVLKNKQIVSSFLLTVFIVVTHTALHIAFTFVSAYPLSKKHFRGRTQLLMFVLITMLFSGGLIPSYILITSVLKWQDNLLVYIVPGIISGFNIIVVKNFLQTIPDSLEESAKLDGANDFIILFKIYLPLSMPILATIALWAGVGKWNNWMTGILYISKTHLLPMQNILRELLISASSTDASGHGGNRDLMALADNIKMATVVVGTLPIILVYPFVQKYFTKGVLLGSVKG